MHVAVGACTPRRRRRVRQLDADESGVWNDSASHTTLSKPLKPPWRVFGLLLMSSEYVVLSSVKRPLRDAVAVAADDRAEVRFATRGVPRVV